MTPRLALSLALLATFAPGSLTSGSVEADRLMPGQRREREMASPAASHVYEVLAPANAYLHVSVRPMGIDVVVTVTGPQGEPVAGADDAWTARPEELEWIAAVEGTYRIEVRNKRPAAPAPASGRYEIHLSDFHPATPADQTRVAAARALWEGRQLLSEQKAERTREAIPAFDKALALSQSDGDARHQALALSGLGNAAIALSDYVTAIERLEAALGLWYQVDDGPQQAATLSLVSSALQKLGRFEEALECAEQAVALSQEGADREGEARGLLEVAVARQSLRQSPLAQAADERALSLFRQMGDRRGEAEALSNLVAIAYGQGDLDRALDILHEIVPLNHELGDRFFEALNLNSLGTIYNSVGEANRALPHLERALVLSRELGDRAAESIILGNVALAHRANGEYARSAEVLEEALVLKGAIGDRRGEATVLNGLGSALGKRGELARARDAFQRSLSIPQASSATRLAALSNLALLAIRSGDLAEARRLSLQALDLTPSWNEASGPLYRLAQVEQGFGDLAEADALAELALEPLEGWRTGVRNVDIRSSMMGTWRESYDLRVNILMARHAADPAAGFEAQALQAVERGRARSVLDLLAESRAEIRQGVDAALLARERTLRTRLSEASARTFQPSSPGGAAPDVLKNQLEELSREVEGVAAEIRKQSPRYAALTAPEPVAVAEIQALLDEDTLLLEYTLGAQGAYAWLLGPRSLASVVLPSRETIEAAARQAFAALESPDVKDGLAVAELSRLVLGPFAPRLKGRRLVVVADGALQYIPFAALPHPTTGAPLAATHEVVSLPSASTLALLRQERGARSRAARTVAVLADPVFDASDERLGRAGATTRPAAPRRLTRAAEDAGLSGRIPRLPFTRREAQAIVASAPPHSTLAALDFEASRATVMDPKLAQYRVLHFATHGFLNASRPELSGILLSLFDREGHPQPGFLTAADTFNLKLNADLVVLSGCRTALGRETKGEGIVGLTRGFMYAGADRVLASLWRVDDAATAALMSRFYARILGPQALPPAAALRAAQLDLMKQPRYRHPYFWAAFQLQGDWN